MTRGGYRGEHAVRFSRRLPVIKVTMNRIDHQILTEISKGLNPPVPVIELLHRIVNHKDFRPMIDDIGKNIAERWHEQPIADNYPPEE